MANDQRALGLLREAEDAIHELRNDSDSPAIARLESVIARLKEQASGIQTEANSAVPSANDDTLG